jgi:hypothetical protein
MEFKIKNTPRFLSIIKQKIAIMEKNSKPPRLRNLTNKLIFLKIPTKMNKLNNQSSKLIAYSNKVDAQLSVSLLRQNGVFKFIFNTFYSKAYGD